MRSWIPVLGLLGLLGSGWSCGDPPARSRSPTASADRAPDVEEPTPVPTVAETENEILVVFLGDSLTAGLGLEEAQAFPARTEEELRARGIPIRAVNAGVSGDTSAGGLRRLDWLLRQEPDLLVLELGVNDALRGRPIEEIEENLRSIVTRARAVGVPTLLLGLQVPPSYGSEYAEGFRAVYPSIARELDVPLVPFLLEGVAGDPTLNFPDGIHPTAAGHEIMATTVAERLARLLGPITSGREPVEEPGS